MKTLLAALSATALTTTIAIADESTKYNDLRKDATQTASVEANAATRDGTVVRGEMKPGNVVNGEEVVTFSSRNEPRNSGYTDTYRAGGVCPFNDSR